MVMVGAVDGGSAGDGYGAGSDAEKGLLAGGERAGGGDADQLVVLGGVDGQFVAQVVATGGDHLGDGRRHTLDSIEIPIVDAIDAAGLQVTADGSAAIIDFRDGGETTKWLLVQDLDQPAPRILEITDVAGRLAVLDPRNP